MNMISTNFSYLNAEQCKTMRKRVFQFLESYGVKLDPHPQMFKYLRDANLQIDEANGIIRFPSSILEELIKKAPKSFVLGSQSQDTSLPLPRPDGTFYARTATGAHGYIDAESGKYRKLTLEDLAQWANLANQLEEISFLPYLYADDAPAKTEDVHALATLLKSTPKHIWVQPYSSESVEHLIALGAAAAGGYQALTDNPVISIIACSLTPRCFKEMDIDIILEAAKAGIPIHACSLPGAGGTAPATIPGTVLLAVAEILAMTAMAQAVNPATPVVACPIIFSTDMRTGRSLQSSVEAIRGASLAVQLINREFGLPTHCYGSGTDSPTIDGQSFSERSMLTTWMAACGLDILGGLGQLEVATAVSPLQLIIDNEILAMARRLIVPFQFDDDQLAWEVLKEVSPGQEFLTNQHTLLHCRDGFSPFNFTRLARDSWEKSGARSLLDRVKDAYSVMANTENRYTANEELVKELDNLVDAADRALR
jgi:trimethylamine:corrinoid methyltransferase-like protein